MSQKIGFCYLTDSFPRPPSPPLWSCQ